MISARFSLCLCQGLDRDLDRLGEIRAAARDDLGVEFLERIEHRAVIDRERRLEKRAARKRDEPHAVAAELRDQILRRELCAREPAGREIVCQHALRDIDGEQHVAAFALALLPRVAELRLREARDDQCRTGEQQSKSQPPLADAHGSREPILEARSDEQAQQLRATPLICDEDDREEWQERERPEPLRLGEGHGSLLPIVSAITSCAASNANPDARSHGNRSRYCLYWLNSTVDFSSLSICSKICASVFVSVAR